VVAVGTAITDRPPHRSIRAELPAYGSCLTKLDFSQFKPGRFEFEKKDEQINMRVPKPLLAAVKARAKARGIPYTRFIRETPEVGMLMNGLLFLGLNSA
jgi:CopG antitoxin of type II toxin-antitoxin system